MYYFFLGGNSMASGELEVLRCESNLWSGHCCTRCRAELGRIINRGANCRACRERICMSCREYSTATNAPEWLCIRCHKEKIEYVINARSSSFSIDEVFLSLVVNYIF